MKTNKLCIVLYLLLGACVEDIDIENKWEQKIVVNCTLDTSSVQILKLTYSNPLGVHYYDEVETATVSLYEDSSMLGHFTKTAYAHWELKYRPRAGKSYQLKVEVPEHKEIRASTTMPFPLQISKANGNDSGTRKHLNQKMANSPYWLFILRQKKSEQYPMNLTPQVSASDELENQLGTNHPFSDHFNISDPAESFIKQPFDMYIRIETPEEKAETPHDFYIEGRLSKCLLFCRAASPEYDRYLKSSIQKILVYEASEDPSQWFDENEVYSNIENGLGIFAAYSDHILMYDDDWGI
ncbi:DUF4249 family protein [Marinifilum caeruleilacunae]|uniref:DUF4249 domain-containing protein n=1 Tax=Marinifilum caeruleilacunae TaxID=2499076 RepID=A0ABX1WXW6_9BACT|nr:DUF4249 family protein [Marinifilum caeruleilacunae]NOU60937.1 DUF4249 domain-containing protein [Marinifilum caeruleilacunae]